MHQQDGEDPGPRPRVAGAVAPAALGVDGAVPGTVYLVGAGPGDPGLLTVRAAALLATADLVAYDRLSPDEVLTLVPAGSELICVGKTRSVPGWPQAHIGELLVRAARSGKAVVRLKGGDPFVFGRGGEEALACREAGVPVQVVSGVSSAIAAAGAAGIPVTHRNIATGVAFVTGHEDPTKPRTQIDWQALARFHGTLVFLMGLGSIARIASSLLENGLVGTTPVAVVGDGTTLTQRTIVADLTTIAEAVHRAGLDSPAAVVVGDVVSMRDRLGDLSALAGLGAPSASPVPAGSSL